VNMRTIRRIALRGCLVLLALAAFTYAADDLWVRYRGRPAEKIRVAVVYAELDRYDKVEYSAGPLVMQTCIDALLPHCGSNPCWYLRRHTLQQIGP